MQTEPLTAALVHREGAPVPRHFCRALSCPSLTTIFLMQSPLCGMLDKPPAPKCTASINPGPTRRAWQPPGRRLLSLLPRGCSALLLLLPQNPGRTEFLGHTRSSTSLWSCQLPGYSKHSRAGSEGGRAPCQHKRNPQTSANNPLAQGQPQLVGKVSPCANRSRPKGWSQFPGDKPFLGSTGPDGAQLRSHSHRRGLTAGTSSLPCKFSSTNAVAHGPHNL